MFVCILSCCPYPFGQMQSSFLAVTRPEPPVQNTIKVQHMTLQMIFGRHVTQILDTHLHISGDMHLCT